MWQYKNSNLPQTDYLMHHGIKGQKWGVRRFQNEDGTLTEEGKKRYGSYKMTKEHIWNQLQENYDLFTSSHKDEDRASKRFKGKPSLKEYFRIEDEVNQITKDLHKDPKSKYAAYSEAARAYDSAKKLGISEKEKIRLKNNMEKLLYESIQEDMWTMYQHVFQNYPKAQVPQILAMLYGGVYNHDYGE